jgi:feruloyl esterase
VCDALDGVVDGLIRDPRDCKFDPATLQCSGADAPTCLTAAQVQAVKDVYAGPRNPRTGKSLYPGLQPGSEFLWPGDRGALGIGMFKFMVFADPGWDFNSLGFDKGVQLADTKLAAIINSTSPDLRAFRKLGGKLLMYHGWDDPRVNPQNSLDYLNSVAAAMRDEHGEDDGEGVQNTGRFLRLFMASGMGHCSGGPGLNTFDTLTALEKWVERGVAPDKLIAGSTTLPLAYNVSTPGSGALTRPLCPHPQVAQWTGKGSTNDAANFVCASPRGGGDGDERDEDD